MKFLLYLLRRLLWVIPVVLVVTFIVFVVSRILPGNPVYLMIGSQQTTEETIARLTREMGLDKPILVQYMMYLNDLSHGDLGTAWHTSNPVTKDILARFPATLELTLVALLLSIFIGIPLGVAAAVYKDSLLDHFVRLVSLVGLSVPSFWLGLVLIYFLCFQFEILPTPMGRVALNVTPPNRITGLYIVDSLLTGNSKALISSVRQIILPTSVLALGQIAGISRMVRSTMVEVLDSDYIRAARAYGIPDNKIYYSYALKNTLIPTITHVAAGVLWLLGGVVVVEIVFTWPGIGLYATESIFVKDYSGVQGVALLIAMLSVLVYLTMDILYFVVDPRVEY
jgi:peptide/nickel transport system permease protein